jgi:hypothetical protein
LTDRILCHFFVTNFSTINFYNFPVISVASYPMNIGSFSSEVKLPERETDSSLPSFTEIKNTRSRDSSNSTGLGWTIGVLGFDFWRGMGIFLFTTASRTVLGPTQPPIQWVPGALSLGVKLPGPETNHSPPTSAEVKE